MIKAGKEYLSSTINVNNYVIKEKNDLDTLRNMVEEGNKFEGTKVRIINDIDLGGSIDNRNWIPIGNESAYFSGILEGNNYKILNLYNKDIENSNQGLFGYLENATIQNVQINSGSVRGIDYVGSIVGKAKNINIINCINNVEITAENGYAGGIAGLIEENVTIERCVNNSNGSSTEYVNDTKDTFIGGIIGASYANISESANNGNITSIYSATGGIAGESFKEISNCDNNGIVQVTGKNINSDSTIGGIVGYIENGKVENCNNNNEVKSEGNFIGGIAGISNSSDIVNCNNVSQININSGCYIGGTLGGFSGEQKVIENCTNSGYILVKGASIIDGNAIAGGICGRAEKAVINNCINTGDVTSNGSYVGGICGTTLNSITNSQNSGNITVNEANKDKKCHVGGIAGQIDAGYVQGEVKIDNCNNSGIVYGNGDHVAGITAVNIGAVVQNSFNTANVNSTNGIVGGIVGEALVDNKNTKPIVKSSYNTGDITSQNTVISGTSVDSYVGGIVAGNHGIVSSCWNSGKITGISCIGGVCGASLDTISDSYNVGIIESIGKNANGDSTIGGIAGVLELGSISYCYNRGEVIAESRLTGGLIGIQKNNSTLSYSYNTFDISEGEFRSNLVGKIEGGTKNNCYYLSTITSGEERQENDMKTEEFINLIGGSSKWKLDSGNINNGFIILSWQ